MLAGHRHTSSGGSCFTAWHCRTPAQQDRFPQEPAGTWSPSHTPAVGSQDWQVPRDADRTSSALGHADMQQAAKGRRPPQPAVTVGRARPWATRLGEDGTGGRLAPGSLALLSGFTAHLGLYFGLVLTSDKWSVLARRGDGWGSPIHPPASPFSWAADPQGRFGLKSASPEVCCWSPVSCLVPLTYSIRATSASCPIFPS